MKLVSFAVMYQELIQLVDGVIMCEELGRGIRLVMALAFFIHTSSVIDN